MITNHAMTPRYFSKLIKTNSCSTAKETIVYLILPTNGVYKQSYRNEIKKNNKKTPSSSLPSQINISMVNLASEFLATLVYFLTMHRGNFLCVLGEKPLIALIVFIINHQLTIVWLLPWLLLLLGYCYTILKYITIMLSCIVLILLETVKKSLTRCECNTTFIFRAALNIIFLTFSGLVILHPFFRATFYFILLLLISRTV